ncbi:MAG: MarR family transcriptional regulator [Clostridia bacterium]|nr:MarR family transcriptional regulator [Clostridia bacterium]
MSGLTYTQYIVFMALWETDGQTVGDLCKKLYLDSGTLTPLLKKMEHAGWVTRKRSEQDERVVEIHLTDEGWNMREQLKDIPAQVGMCVSLKPEEAQLLYKLLYEILEV